MKILLLSDSHLYNDILDKILNTIKADMIIHCGDSVFESDDFRLDQMITVKGNHDFTNFDITKEITVENHHILITHGHKFQIYEGYEHLYQYMIEHDLDICFHGHTHVPYLENYKGKLFVNPGSTMYNRGNTDCGSYAIVDLDKDHVDVKFYNSQTFKQIPQSIIDSNIDILEEFKDLVKNYIKQKD